MTSYYLDTSAAVKAYYEERGGDRVEEILERGSEVHLSRVGIVEVVAALFGKVRSGDIGTEEAALTVQEFRSDVETVYRISEVIADTAERAIDIAERRRLRACDCLQLATALILREQRAAFGLSPLVLVSSDRELDAAASSEGMTVEDPAAP